MARISRKQLICDLGISTIVLASRVKDTRLEDLLDIPKEVDVHAKRGVHENFY